MHVTLKMRSRVVTEEILHHPARRSLPRRASAYGWGSRFAKSVVGDQELGRVASRDEPVATVAEARHRQHGVVANWIARPFVQRRRHPAAHSATPWTAFKQQRHLSSVKPPRQQAPAPGHRRHGRNQRARGISPQVQEDEQSPQRRDHVRGRRHAPAA